MTDPVAFLAARLDEDEAIALGVSDGPRKPEEWVARRMPWSQPGPQSWAVDCPLGAIVVDGSFKEAADHIARHDPARVLREVAAKRAILAEHMPGARFCWNEAEQACQRCGDVVTVQWPCATVRQLLSVYRGHPDYDQEWKL